MNEQSKELCDFFLNNTNDIILIIDRNGSIQSISPSSSSILSISENDLLSASFFSMVDKKDKRKIERVMNQSDTERKTNELQVTIHFPNSKPVKCNLVVQKTPLDLSFDGLILLIKNNDTKSDIKKDFQEYDICEFINYSLDFIFKTTLSGEFVFVNNACKHIAGYEPEEMIGTKWMNYAPKKELPKYLKKVKELVAGKKITDFQTYVIHKDGHLIPVEFSGHLIHDNKKRYIIGVMRDLSNRNQSNLILEDLNKQLQKQMEIEKERIKKQHISIQEYIDQYHMLFEKAKESIVIAQGDKLVNVNTAFEKLVGMKKEEIYKKKFIDFIHPDDREKVYSRYKQRIAGKKVKSHYQFRAITDEKRISWIEIYTSLITWNGKPSTLSFLIDITDKKSIDEKYQILFDIIPDAITEIDYKTRNIISVNDEMIKRFQIPKETLIGMNYKDVLPKTIHTEREKIGKQAIKENRIIKVVDSRDNLWLENSYIPINYPSGRKSLLVMSRDISDIKKSENKLRASEEKFKEIFDSSTDAIFIHDAKTLRIMDVNKECLDRFGYTKDEIRKKTINDLTDTKHFNIDSPETKTLLQKVIQGESIRTEWLSKKKDGTTIWHELIGKLITIGGEHRFLVIARDITERKKAEEKLRIYSEKLEETVSQKTRELQISETKYRTLFKKAPIGIGIINQQNTIIEMNKSLEEITGFSLHPKTQLDLDFSYHCVDKDDRKTIREKLLKHNHIDNYEIQLRRKNGEIYTGLLNVDTITLDGKPYWLFIERDISDIKEKEQELKETYSYLEKTINSASECIFAIDKDFRITMHNKAFQMLLGEQKKKLNQKSLKSFLETSSSLTHVISQIKKGGRTIKNTMIIITSEGEKRLLSYSVSGIGIDRKNPEGFLFIGVDITRDASKYGKIQDRKGYLIIDPDERKLDDLIDYLSSKGYDGTIHTRENSLFAQKYETNEHIGIQFYPEIAFNKDVTKAYLQDRLDIIKTFLSSHDSCFIVVDRLDYLLTHFQFDLLMKWFYELSSLIIAYQAIVFIRVPHGLVSKDQLFYLSSEFSFLPDQQIQNIALEESLFNILLYIKREQETNVLVSYHHVGKRFNISKVTTKKRLDELEHKGLISVKEKGRMKVISLTAKGETLLNKRDVI